MSGRFVRVVLRIYPADYRARYGAELVDLCQEIHEADGTAVLVLVAGIIRSAAVERLKSLLRVRPLALGTLVVVAAVTTAIVASNVGSPGRSGSAFAATKGTMPHLQSGRINLKGVPDFIAVIDRHGHMVGYTPRGSLLPGAPGSAPPGMVAPVYASNLKTLVGHMYPGTGFVPLGSSPAAQPCTPMSITQDGGQPQPVPCPSVEERVPDVVGLYAPTALGQISSHSLSVSVVMRCTTSMPSGHVAATMPKGGTKVPARTVVIVTEAIRPAGSSGTCP